jgi:signal transduction histidine kinase
MSNLKRIPDYLERLLLTFGGEVAMALSRAIRLEQLELSDLFDHAVAESMVSETSDEAARKFVGTLLSAKDLLGTDLVHIRLATEDRKALRLVAGAGEYYRAARKERPVIPAKDDSPTAKCFREGVSRWVNNTKEDRPSQRLVAHLQESLATRKILAAERAYANIILRSHPEEPPMGVLTIASNEAWFFSESRWRSMKALGQRLCIALKHARQVQAQILCTQELGFLLKITPVLGQDADLRTSLANNAGRIAAAARAQKVSFFLWDKERRLLVLRGQAGWKRNMIGRATYALGEGMTGKIAEGDAPEFISNLTIWKEEHRQAGQHAKVGGKYEAEMFGKKRSGVRYEVVGIPLREAAKPDDPATGLLGILTLQNAIEGNIGSTQFATTDENVLRQAQLYLVTYLVAAHFRDDMEHRRLRAERLKKMLLLEASTVGEVAARASHLVKALHHLEACAVYLQDEDTKRLRLAGDAGFDEETSVDDPAFKTLAQGTVAEDAFVNGKARDFGHPDRPPPKADASVEQFAAGLPSRRIKSLRVVPLTDRSRQKRGVLVLCNIRDRDGEEHPWFTAADRDELDEVAVHIASAVSRQHAARMQLEAAIQHDQAKNLMADTSSLLLNVIHKDLGQAITSIHSTLDQLIYGPLNEEQRGLVCDAKNSGAAALESVKSTLKFICEGARLSYGELDLRVPLEQAADEARAVTPATKIVIAQGPPIIIKGAQQSLRQAFFNVIYNSLKAMGSDPQARLTIETSLDAGKKEARVVFSDRGPGFPEEDRLGILRDGVCKAAPDGRLRMGLFITKFTVGQHGGKLDIPHQPKGAGAKVVITLPYIKLDRKEP